MRVIFMGKDKSCEALRRIIDLGVEVVAVVVLAYNKQSSSESKLYDIAKFFQLPVCSDDNIYEHIAKTKIMDIDIKNIDMVISFLFPKRIKKPLINLSRLGCINFHSAPLPEYRGWGVYNAAILNNERRWGVSAHFVDNDFDTGDIIKVDYFDIDPKKETAFSLERRSQQSLLELFDKVMKIAISGESLPRERQNQGIGTTYTKRDTLNHETVNFDDSVDIADAKIRAFWYPPFAAKIILNGEKRFLIPSEIMEDIAAKYNKG